MSEDNNPYAAPSSNLEQTIDGGSSRLLPAPRSLPAGRGWGWIKDGFQFFKRSPLNWILGSLLGLVIVIVLNFIPIIGQLIYMLAVYVLVGGVMLGCHAQSRGEPFEVRYLFAAFSKPTKLIVLSLLMTVASMVIMGLAYGPAFLSMMTLSPGDTEGAVEATQMLGDPQVFLMKVLVSMLVFIPITMAVWFSPPLIAINDLSVVDALKTSFTGCLKNILPFLVFGVLGIIFYILAFIPIGLGLFVFFPTFTAATYVAYRDIFTESA